MGANLLNRLWEKIYPFLGGARRLLEYVVALLVAIEAIIFIEHQTGFYQKTVSSLFSVDRVNNINEILSPISEFLVSYTSELGFFLSAMLAYIVLRTTRDLNVAETQFERARELSREQMNQMLKYDASGEILRQLSAKNSACDKDVFHILFLDHAGASRLAHRASIQAAMRVVRANLIDVLDAAAAIFSIFTGDKCAACIQVIDSYDDKEIENSTVKTLQRDSLCTDRDAVGRSHAIKNNTLHKNVFIDGTEFIIEENLQKKICNGFIKTSSVDVGKRYNSVLICAIPNMHEEIGTEKISTLCVDNILGGFQSVPKTMSEQYAKRLAWRLAVMLYRLDQLELQLKQLDQPVGNQAV